MKCVECVDYAECRKKHNLTIKRKRCTMAKAEYVQTNADRIRAMSDEELAELLWGFEKEEIARATEYALEKRKIAEWLKQPMEE